MNEGCVVGRCEGKYVNEKEDPREGMAVMKCGFNFQCSAIGGKSNRRQYDGREGWTWTQTEEDKRENCVYGNYSNWFGWDTPQVYVAGKNMLQK